MPQSSENSHRLPMNDAAPNARFDTTVPAAPISIAFLPPSRSVNSPFSTCPNAYA